MNIAFECEKKCPDCPLADYVYTELAKIETDRDKILDDTDLVMQLNAETEEPSHKPVLYKLPKELDPNLLDPPVCLTEHEHNELVSRLTAKPADYYQRSEGFFQLLDKREPLLKSILEDAQRTCDTGPVIKRRYIIFGQKVIMCGGQSIATSRQVRPIDNNTSVC